MLALDPSPGTAAPTDSAAHAKEIAQTLTDAGAKLVCIDFDATFVSVHTGGTWTKSPEDLRVYARDLFLALVPLLMEANISVAVVTFSPQVDLIRAVLRLCWTNDITDRLIIRCDDSSWRLGHTELLDFAPLWQVTGMHFDRKYKLPYVVSAAREASDERGELIRNRDTILFDDDGKNIRIAIDNGITGIYFEPDGAEPTELCRRIRKLHAPPPAPTAPPLLTPSKRKNVRVLETPEAPHRVSNRTSHSARMHGTPIVARMPRPKKFSLCTPSPVMKLKTTVEMGRPRSKRATRLGRSPRSIEGDMHALHVVQEANESPSSASAPPSPPPPSSPPRPLRYSLSSPRSPDCRFGSFT